jgi:hypothetical protein
MRACVTAPATHKGIVAAEPRYKTAGKLIVATGLRAATPAIHLVSAERLIGKGAAWRPDNPFRRLAPKPVSLAARVAAGPIPNGSGQSRGVVEEGLFVGRGRRTRERK